MDELESARRYKTLCDQWAKDISQAMTEPLTFTDHTVETGTLWIGLTCPATVKVYKPKHSCPACGAKHTMKGGAV